MREVADEQKATEGNGEGRGHGGRTTVKFEIQESWGIHHVAAEFKWTWYFG